jgi:hypothetical protein
MSIATLGEKSWFANYPGITKEQREIGENNIANIRQAIQEFALSLQLSFCESCGVQQASAKAKFCRSCGKPHLNRNFPK